MNPATLIGMLLTFANRLKFRNLFLITAGLFLLDLLVPDLIPMIDEIILGLLTVILANWKKERAQERQGTLIEGKIVDKEESK